MCSRGRSATCEDDQGGDPELTMSIRKSVIINEYEFDKVNPNDTILTMTPLESNSKEVAHHILMHVNSDGSGGGAATLKGLIGSDRAGGGAGTRLELRLRHNQTAPGRT